MRNRFATRMSRTSDRRKDVMASRGAGWTPVSPPPTPPDERVRAHECEILALASLTGFPEAEVRSLFEGEFARLACDGTADAFLTVRTGSNVLTILRGRSLLR